MRKIILDLAVTLDGFIEGSNGEVDWCIMDDEMDFNTFLANIDTILYGRISYDLWGQYQPDNSASTAMQDVFTAIHTKHKVVFSKTVKVKDENVRVISTDIEQQVRSLKRQPGKDIWLYGGAKLITTFIDLNLIDEYRLSVHPIVLGKGKPIFDNIRKRINLILTQTRVFKSGVIQLCYQPQNNV